MAEYTIELPAGLELLSANGREHWARRNRITQSLKKAAWAMALQARTPRLERADITITYQPPDRRRRDPDNLAPSGKACIDGIVLAGVLPDDNSAHVAAVHYTIGAIYPRGRVVLHVREVVTA